MKYFKVVDGEFVKVKSPLVADFPDLSPSVTDKSSYRPDVDDVRNFLASGVSSNVQLLYDGDTPSRAEAASAETVLRNPGLDLAEAAKIQEHLARKVSKAIKEASEELAASNNDASSSGASADASSQASPSATTS